MTGAGAALTGVGAFGDGAAIGAARGSPGASGIDCRFSSTYAYTIGAGFESLGGHRLSASHTSWPTSLHTSCRTVFTMRSGLSSHCPRRRISSTPREWKNACTSPSSVGRFTASRFWPKDLVSLIRHLTTRSWNLTSAAGSSATDSGASARSLSSARKEFVRGQCSKSLSMSTLRALTS